MIILDRKDENKLEALQRYYEQGWLDMNTFYESIDWGNVKLFEPNPAEVYKDGTIHHQRAELWPAKKALLNWAVEQIAEKPVDYLEFGVCNGNSLREVIHSLHNNENARFYGFDTFEGLPEAWVEGWGGFNRFRVYRDKGELNSKGVPNIEDDRVKLYKGLFQETLPDALRDIFPYGREDERPLFVNIDCDIYSGALYVLTMMHSYLRAGDYLYFDEFYDSMNEFPAFNDYCRSYYCKNKFQLIGRAFDGYLFKVTSKP